MRKYIYYGTCNAGTQEIVKKIIREKIADVTDVVLYEGAVLFSSGRPHESLKLDCFNNLFYVLDTYKNNNRMSIIEQHVGKVLKCRLNRQMSFIHKESCNTFRIMISRENQFVSIKPKLKNALEDYISGCTRLKVNREGADKEFWFLSRSEGVCFFLYRLTKHTSYEKKLRKGELHPEIAYILGWLGHVKSDDAVLDPFCGYGALPYQLLKSFPLKSMIASDIDSDMVSLTQNKLTQSMRKKCKVFTCDVTCLEKICDRESIDIIVTDPPWGFYENITNIELFYLKMMDRFDYVMKKGAVAVVLTASKEEFNDVLKQTKGFKMTERYDILVSGKKAAIFKILKM